MREEDPTYKSIQDWVDELSATMAVETDKILSSRSSKYKPVVQRALKIRFLQNSIKLLLADVLGREPENMIRDANWEAQLMKDFQSTKLRLTNEIGEAFSSVMSKVNGKPQEYYCRLEWIPEPASKTQH